MLDRGHQVDWFQSAETWIYLGVAISAAWVGVIHLATTPEPLFKRVLFADRNFSIVLFFMLVVGVTMFATMALLPPMLQRLFGYTVIDTGEAMMPRGVGTLITMQLSGLLMRRGFDGRIMVALGMAVCGFSMWQMAGWSLAVDRSQVMTSGFIQGIGLGLVFIPLNTIGFATLPQIMRTDASSILNLGRSIGSSVGISIVTALLASNQQVSHSDIASNVTASFTDVIDFSTIDRFQGMGDAALAMVDAEINRQAAMIAFVDDFYFMMWLNFLAIPLLLLMRRVQPLDPAAKAESTPAAH